MEFYTCGPVTESAGVTESLKEEIQVEFGGGCLAAHEAIEILPAGSVQPDPEKFGKDFDLVSYSKADDILRFQR